MQNFEYYDKERGVSLGGRTRIITVELAKLEYLLGVPVGEMNGPERWAFYFRYIRDKGKREKINEIIKYEEGIEMATEVLMTMNLRRASPAVSLVKVSFQRRFVRIGNS